MEWDFLNLIFLIIMFIVITIMLFVNINRRNKNKKLIGSMQFKFKGKGKGYLFWVIVIQLFNLLSSMVRMNEENITNPYEAILYILGLSNVSDAYIGYNLVVAVMIAVLLILLTIYEFKVKSEVYHEGILKDDGKLITWNNIEIVEFEDAIWRINKKANFKMKNGKDWYEVIESESYEDIRYFMSEKVKIFIKKEI